MILLKKLMENETVSDLRYKYTTFSKKLKNILKKLFMFNITVETSQLYDSDPYITVSVPIWVSDFLPNDFRVKVLKIIYPNAKILDKNDIVYNNIEKNEIKLKYSEWVKVLDELYPDWNKDSKSNKDVVKSKILKPNIVTKKIPNSKFDDVSNNKVKK